LIKAPFTSSHYYDEGGQMSPNVENYDIFGNSNPYVLANNNLLDNLSYRFVGSFLLGTKINNYLNINAFFGINFNKGRERVFYSTTGIYFDPINDTYIRNQSQHRVDRLLSLFGNAYINYERQFSFKHKVTAQAGVRYQNNNAEDDFGMGFNSLSDDFKSIGYGDALLRRVGGSIGAWDWLSLYAHADYAYKGRYLLNVALSSDQTSRSGEQAPAVFMYPQAAVAWIASSERFMQDVQGVSLLKFRFSSGLSGNDEIGNYTARRYYVSQNILGNYGMALGNFAETTLRPEKTFKLNGGIDLSALDERVNLSIDLYSNKITDMILLTTPDQRTGFDSYFANAGSMQNTGIDLSTNFRLINKQSFTWDLAIQASSYRNKILDLSGEKLETNVMGATIQTKVGQPLGIFYGYQTDGVFSTAAEANNEGLYEMHGLVKVPFGAGDVRFVNQTVGDKLIDENDRVKIGDPNPDLFGSISNTFKYKNFTLRAFFTYSLGNDVYNYTRSQLESLSTYNNQSLSTLMRWRKEGDVTTFPKAALGDPMGNARFSDRWIEDGSYLRMKSLSVSYDVPSKNIKAIGTLTVFATVENLLTISAYKGSDPEFSFGQSALYYGIDPGVLAQPRIFSLGFNLGL
jgi:TonB-linked SusC/RagA family outer membrane protein